MLRRYYLWRARRKMGKSRYRPDRRHYAGHFRAGFYSYLSSTRFWDVRRDAYYKRRKRRSRLLRVLLLLFLGVVFWIVYESVGALGLFSLLFPQ